MSEKKKTARARADGFLEGVGRCGDVPHPHNNILPIYLQEAAKLHEEYAFYCLDKCSDLVHEMGGSFGVWFGRMLNSLTCCEVLQRRAAQ